MARCLFHCVYCHISCFRCAEPKGGGYYARAIPMEIPPMAIRMHIRINMIRIMIFVDFFISFLSFQNESGHSMTGWHKYNTRNL